MNILGSTNVLEFLSNLGIQIIQTYSEIFNWFSYTIHFPNGFELSVFQVIFSTGLVVYLGSVVFKWLIHFII